eukprot:UN34693
MMKNTFWDNFKPEVQTSLAKPKFDNYSTVHVRRGDKCLEESTCYPFALYYVELLAQTNQDDNALYIFSDELDNVVTEYLNCCDDGRGLYTPESTSDIDLFNLINEINIGAQATESIVCTGSSNICRILWSLSELPNESFINLDTKSVMCGDKR